MVSTKKDENGIPVLIGVSNVDGVTPVMVYVDPTTHRMLVDLAAGSGTVTSVSVVTANGISGTVATATTTPAITLTLGAITPSAIQVSGLTASEIVGTDGSKNLVSLVVATYPSLTELTYVKGVTSAVQTQLGTKAPTAAPTFTGAVTVVDQLLFNSAVYTQIQANVANVDLNFKTVAGTGNIVLSPNAIDAVKVTNTNLEILLGHDLKMFGSTSGSTTVKSGAVAGSSVLTLPVATDTLVGKATTDTMTNKTLTTPAIASVKGTLTADTDGATITFDKNVSDYHGVTLGGNRTLALSNMAAGDRVVLRLLQDATGSRTVTWFTTIKWVGGTVPTLTTTASKADTFGFLCTSAGNYDGFIVGQNI